MGGSISSLGIGSGVLTSDVIDQLKAADTSKIITPMENKITINNQKQDAQELLTNLMKSLKTSASALSYDTVFDNKTIDVSGNAEVTVDAGANVETFSLETIELAQKEISQFSEMNSKGSTIATGVGTLSIAGFSVSYDGTTTLEQLAQAITDEAGSKVLASILETNTGKFTLVLSSKETGASEALAFTDTSGLLEGAFTVGYTTLQPAQDSEFKYNGITVTRNSNEIDDLIVGVNITLKEKGDISTVDIKQDTTTITDELQLFVDTYNTLMTNLGDMTAKDKKTGAEGIFNSSTFVKGLSRDLAKSMTSVVDGDTLLSYGIDIDRYGTMSFNKSVLETKLEDDPAGVELFFTGGTNSSGTEVNGIFENINEKINNYTGYGKLLSTFGSDLKTEGENLTDSYIHAKESLDTRYEIMTKRFIAYDAIISKINAQFSSMQMMINAEANGN